MSWKILLSEFNVWWSCKNSLSKWILLSTRHGKSSSLWKWNILLQWELSESTWMQSLPSWKILQVWMISWLKNEHLGFFSKNSFKYISFRAGNIIGDCSAGYFCLAGSDSYTPEQTAVNPDQDACTEKSCAGPCPAGSECGFNLFVIMIKLICNPILIKTEGWH